MSGESIGGANAGAIKASIDFDADGLERAVNKAMDKATATVSQKVEAASQEIQGKMESGFKGLGHKIIGFLGVEDISSAVNNIGRYIVGLGMQTEKELNNFRAVSGATADEMKRVSDEAIALGDDIKLPGVSAGDAAEAMTELAKAGFTVQQSMDAAKGTLQLATAAQTGAGEAAHIAAEQINAFNLQARDSGKVADVLANAANESAADITGIADSMQQVSAVSHAAGLSLEETASAVALMANNSIQGSDAGTSLKTMLVSLAAPSSKAKNLMDQYGISVYDSQGRLKSLAGIVETLTEGLKGATDQQKQYVLATVFGTDAIRAVNVLMHEGSDGIEEMTKNLTKGGAAARLAAANSHGLVGSLGALQSTAESLAIAFYQKVSPALDEFLRGQLAKLPGELESAERYLGEVVDSLEPAADLLHEFISAASPGALIAFKGGLAALLGVLQATEAVLGPVDDLIRDNETLFREIVGPLAAAYAAYKLLSVTVDKSKKAWDSAPITKARAGFTSLSTSMKSATTVASGFRRVGTSILTAFDPWTLAITGAATAVGIFAAKHAEAKAKVDELRDSLDAETGAITKNTRATVAKRLEDEGLLEAAQKVGIATNTLVDAALGQVDANHKIAESYIQVFNASTGLDDHARDMANKLLPNFEKIRNGLGGIKGDVDAAQASQERLSSAVYGTVKAGGDFSRQQTEVSRSMDRSQVATSRFSRATGDSATTLGKQADEADRTKSAIRGLRDEVVKGLDAQVDFQESADNLRKTIHDLTPEEIKSGHALDIHYEAGRAVTRGMIDLAQSAAQVKGGLASARDQIVASYEAMGVSKEKAQVLADQFFDLKASVESVPSFKKVEVDANAQQAIDNVRTLRYEIDQLHDKTVVVRTTGGHTVQGNAGGGAIYGPGTGTSDSILRRLSNGEHVFTAEEVNDAGGQQGIFAIRAALRRGGIPALAELAGGGHGALVENLSLAVGTRDDLPQALDETLFHLRRIGRGGRYNT